MGGLVKIGGMLWRGSKSVYGWAGRAIHNSVTPGSTTYRFLSQKPMKGLMWGGAGFAGLNYMANTEHGLAPVVGKTVVDATFGKGTFENGLEKTQEAVDTLKDASKDVKESVVSMKENVSNMMHSTVQQLPQGGNGASYGAGGYDGYGGYGMNAADVRQQEAAIWNAGQQLGGDGSLLGGMGTMLSNFLSGNALRLAALPAAAWMLFGRHGWMMRIAGLLLGGTMMRQLSAPAIAPSVNNAIDNVQRRYSAPAVNRQPAVLRSNDPAYDAAAQAHGLQYAQGQDYEEDESQYVVHSRRA